MDGMTVRIFRTGQEGCLEDRCRRVLERVGRSRRVVSLVFFFDAPLLEDYLSGEEAILRTCSGFFGEDVPVVTCVAQKPVGAGLAAEAVFLKGKAETTRHGDYLVIRSGRGVELLTAGIHFPEAGDTGEQAVKVFGRLGAILAGEGFKVSDIVRQWNYIEGITIIGEGRQNYQMFNDARSAFYDGADWSGGYPAATGIGCSTGGVTVSLYAVKDSPLADRPIDNPIQVAAHNYSGQVLREGGQALKTTPKFERARLLGDTVFVSGTAAIKGETSESADDPRIQGEATVEVVDSLVRPGNISPGCPRFRFESIRVYVKREEDAEAVAGVVRDRWKGIPAHFLIADICRPELLLEIEGVGTVRRFLECCCTDESEAREAEAGGAGRIELCEDLSCGGVTPSEENLKKVLEAVSIPVNVLVRPRGGNFVFTEEETERMEASIRLCKDMGAAGVVIGALEEDGSVDIRTMDRLIKAADGMSVTFHRAFDECSDPFKALEDIIALGCDRLLTAGHASDVGKGAGMLKELNGKAAGRIVVMAGSGVRPSNIGSLEKLTGIKEFHSSSHGPGGRTRAETVEAMVRTVSLWEIFKVFAKIGSFTIGGGYAMIPLIRDELVGKGWISEEEIPDIVALAQSAPGVLAVNMSIFAGHRLRGFKGSVAATLGAVIPSFLIILLIATVFTGYQDNPVVIRIFKGIRPVVVSLITVPMVRMAMKGNKTWWAWAISAATLILVAFLKFSPIYILLVLMVLAFCFTLFKERRSGNV